jgi:hypothetical protein
VRLAGLEVALGEPAMSGERMGRTRT